MTSLLTILSILVLIVVCWAMAKYNKSDNLFWILLVSLLAGMAGGALINKVAKSTNDDEKISNFEQVYNPTQVSPAICADFCTKLGDARAVLAKPASEVKEIPAFGIKVAFIAPSKTFGEIRGQPNFINPLNKGTPGMPFDTS